MGGGGYRIGYSKYYKSIVTVKAREISVSIIPHGVECVTAMLDL